MTSKLKKVIVTCIQGCRICGNLVSLPRCTLPEPLISEKYYFLNFKNLEEEFFLNFASPFSCLCPCLTQYKICTTNGVNNLTSKYQYLATAMVRFTEELPQTIWPRVLTPALPPHFSNAQKTQFVIRWGFPSSDALERSFDTLKCRDLSLISS